MESFRARVKSHRQGRLYLELSRAKALGQEVGQVPAALVSTQEGAWSPNRVRSPVAPPSLLVWTQSSMWRLLLDSSPSQFTLISSTTANTTAYQTLEYETRSIFCLFLWTLKSVRRSVKDTDSNAKLKFSYLS